MSYEVDVKREGGGLAAPFAVDHGTKDAQGRIQIASRDEIGRSLISIIEKRNKLTSESN
jgi:hypothetical protein